MKKRKPKEKKEEMKEEKEKEKGASTMETEVLQVQTGHPYVDGLKVYDDGTYDHKVLLSSYCKAETPFFI
jgi:hypothetical protein